MARILLIEPNTVLAQTYQAALVYDGHLVDVTDSAQVAIGLADQQIPDVIVLELQLCAHNGLEFLYELRSYPDWQTIPVIIHSLVPAHLLRGNSVLWQQLGISDYLYKPQTTLRQLVNAVQVCLSTSVYEAA